MKRRQLMFVCGVMALGLSVGKSAVTLQTFSSVVGTGTVFFGTWEATGSLAGSGNPNSQFLQGAGVFDITGLAPIIPTNADTSGLRFDFSSAVNIGTDTSLAVTAKVLPGNVTSSFTVTLLANGNKAATAVFSLGQFSSSAYSTVTATLTFDNGFNPAQVDAMRISGGQVGGTAAFGVSFDQVSVVTEPEWCAAATGAIALGWCAWRRRRRRVTPA